MTREHEPLQPHHLAQMTDETLRDQAENAEAYAHQRPANDLDGFFAAMKDAQACRAELARRARNKGTAQHPRPPY